MAHGMQRLCSIVVMLLIGVSASAAWADDDDNNRRQSVLVSFGRGLNTAQLANHAILPDEIRVKQGGVVNFAVAGFHQIFVYKPGTEAEDIVVPPSGPFLNFNLGDLYYQGLVPANAGLGLPVTMDPSNARNRLESVSFDKPGTYLVVCNIRTHFLDGMFAMIKVSH